MTTKRGRARSDFPKPPVPPKTEDELRVLLEKTWQDACDAEYARADEEYRDLRAAVIAFDAVVLSGKDAWDRTKPPRFQFCTVQEAVDFAHRIRKILDAEPRLKALDVFEAGTGLKVDDAWMAKLDAKAVKVLREVPCQVGIIASNLRLSLGQLESGHKNLKTVLEFIDKTIQERDGG